MNCFGAILKYLIFIINFCFVVFGILLIIFGGIMLGDMGDFTSFDDALSSQTIPILVITLGCIIFVVSFFGCCGAIKENNCCVMIYAIFMFILLVLQLALVIWVFVNRNKFLSTMSDIVDQAWAKNNEANGYPMNPLQISFKCCGVNSYNDYLSINASPPSSCCGSMSGVCSASVYSQRPGCQEKFVSFWESNTDITRWAGLGVIVVEFIALILALILSGSIRAGRQY